MLKIKQFNGKTDLRFSNRYIDFANAGSAHSMLENTLVTSLKSLNSRKIFFGHQSVGQNIIDGIEDLLIKNPDVKFKLVALDSPFDPSSETGYLVHSAIGQNTKPVSKCADFNRIIRSGLGRSVDIALMKFCYIDIEEKTDIDFLFEQYKTIMDDLEKDFPAVKFIHVTVPLRHSETGFSIRLREFIGRALSKPNRSKLTNIKRNQFNRLLRKHYNNAPIFDLEASMSTYPDGKQATFSYEGKSGYPNLISDYTDDGGHLNKIGRTKVAQDFIDAIAQYADE